MCLRDFSRAEIFSKQALITILTESFNSFFSLSELEAESWISLAVALISSKRFLLVLEITEISSSIDIEAISSEEYISVNKVSAVAPKLSENTLV